MSDVSGDYLALRRGVGARVEPVDVVRVSGDDATSYLQGQLSQDVTSLGVGTARWSLLLEPQGKLIALVRVWRDGEDLLVEVDEGAGQRVVDRLRRFLLRVKVDLTLESWFRLALRGQSVAAIDVDLLGDAESSQLAVRSIWPGGDGIDVIAPSPEVRSAAPPDAVLVGAEAFESVRIEHGWPRHGAEIALDGDPTLIPAELGSWLVDASASFTKGCYTGQELVARVDSRGSNTPRKLRGLVVGTNVIPPVGAVVVADGEERGALTSVGESLDLRAPVGLALVHRSVEPGTEVAVTWIDPSGASVSVPAQVRELPLVDGPG